ncbi:MAG TPA: restriction endonuclease subunit S [Pirellulales bacterium]|nr:restriction endonuclease subunit S [Pirellulales bacterium]
MKVGATPVSDGRRQTDVGVIPNDWAVKRLRDISPSQSVGLVINPSTYYDTSGTVPFFVGSNIGENVIYWESASKITEASNDLLAASRLRAGDLVTVRVGDPGVTAVVPPELDGSNCASMMIIRKHSSFNSHWLCWLMNSRHGRAQVEGVQYGTAQKQFNISDAINFQYPIPPLSEQVAIAEALGDADAFIGSLEQLLTKKRGIKRGAMQELLTSKRRLPGFVKKWETKPLGELGTFFSGGTPNTAVSEYYGGTIPWINSSDCNAGRISCVPGRITSAGMANSATKWVKAGTLLIALYGATAGVVAISEIDAAINQAVLAIIPDRDNSEFLFQKLGMMKEWIISTYTQGGQPNLSGTIVKAIEITLPEPHEQAAIAAVLSDMDAEIAALEEKLTKARQIKRGMMQELLTGRIRLV